jgi:hypothetical protein
MLEFDSIKYKKIKAIQGNQIQIGKRTLFSLKITNMLADNIGINHPQPEQFKPKKFTEGIDIAIKVNKNTTQTNIGLLFNYDLNPD